MLQIEKLTNINSVSGNESAVRKELISMISPYADDIIVDTLGNIIALKKGRQSGGRKNVFSAHMDEVGFIISKISDDGYLKFRSVGSIDPRILPAQRVVIGDRSLDGVIGVKAVHLQTADERKNVIKEKDMYIDIGAASAVEAKELVSIGDYATFNSSYEQLGGGRFKAKALDDRVGCAILCELIKGEYESDIYFCFCVQEEVGVRGASVIAARIDAPIAIVLESTTASDTAGLKEENYATMLGHGPAVSIMDRGSYSDRELNRFIFDIADEHAIKYQLKRSGFGGNDARAYQTGGTSCKSAVISLPCRYIHSPVSCADSDDVQNMLELCRRLAQRIHLFETN